VRLALVLLVGVGLGAQAAGRDGQVAATLEGVEGVEGFERNDGAGAGAEKAEALWNAGMFLEARRTAVALLADVGDVGDGGAGEPGARAVLWNVLAKYEEAEGRLEAGAVWRERALALAEALGDRSLASRLESEAGLAAWQRADYPLAARHCTRALDLARESWPAGLRSRALSCLGKIEFKRGQAEAGRRFLDRALAAAREGSDRRQEAVTLMDLGSLELDQRNFALARQRFEAARAAAANGTDGTDGTDVVLQARIEDEIGLVYLFQSLSRAALEQFRRARDMAGASGADAARAHALMLMGQAYRQSRAFGRAIEAYSTALELWRRVGNRREEAWTLARLGRTLALLEDTAGARRHYASALGIWTALGDERARAYHLYEIGRLYEALGETGAAGELYREALRAGEKIELPYRSLALGRIARLLATQGDRSGAERHASQAVTVAQAAANREMQWTAFFDQAEVLLALGRRDEALRAFEKSLEILEDLRHESIPDEEAKAAYFETQRDVFAAAVTLLTQLERHDEALIVAERARGGAVARPAGSGASPRLGEIRERLRGRGATAIEYFSARDRLYVWLIDPAGVVHATTVSVSARRIEELVAALRRELRADRAALRWQEDETGEAGSAMPPGTAAGSAPGAAALAALSPRAAAGEFLAAEARSLSRELFELLILPVAAWLPADPEDPVFVVPHGVLHLVSFGLLVDGDGRFLAERHVLSYLPALGSLGPVLAGSPPVTQGMRGMLAVGDPRMPVLPGRTAALPHLPAAGEEVTVLAALRGGPRVTTLRGAAASEAAIRRLAPGYRVLHFATHGIARDDRPLDSLLALAPGGTSGTADDGLWTAREILAERLHADLVTLSACDTGLGGLTGDGVLGLGRSFLGAGAAAVLVSLWRVEDSVTRYQMVRFYRELWRNGNHGAAALRRAQLDTLAALRARQLRDEHGQPLPPHPAYWAPFVLLGETAGTTPRS
jgi:CHAT domain-containing protein